MNKFFMHRIRRYLKDGDFTWDKGIEIHNTIEDASGSYHAYLGAYAYGRDKSGNTDYVSCFVTDIYGTIVLPITTWLSPEFNENVEG